MKVCMDGTMHTQASVVALGMFDGVHAGHQVLLRRARKLADMYGVPLVVQTFAQHPLCQIAPERCPPQLTTYAERLACLEKTGVDILYAPPFTAEMRDMPPEDFIGHLVRRWHPRAVVVGFNYTFGRGGEGTPALLHMVGHALGFETSIVPEIRIDGISVSSTHIRRLLAQGNSAAARAYLGRAYTRDAEAVAMPAAGQWQLRWAEDDKQAVGPGTYRCRVQSGENAYPAFVSIAENGTSRLSVAGQVSLTNSVTVAFLASCNPGTPD